MTDRTVAIKITSDGKAFVVDQAANAQATAQFGRQVEQAGKQVEAASAKVAAAGKVGKESSDGFKKAGDGAGGAAPQVKQLGDSAQRTAQQMRQVAPQITDIVTQIASGQNPLQIFIQQGGQLKDVFGGVGPALRAVGGYVMGMVGPVTIGVAGIGALAAGFLMGRDESAKFTQQMLLSGNAAGVTASDYYQMAGSLAAIAGTKGAALGALAEMAQGGRVSADQLQRFTGIAQQLDRLVGKPVSDTAKEFIALGEAPVQASLKLTQAYNYLTPAIYTQIKALDDQGRHIDAAKLAQDAFAQANEERIPKMAANVGVLAQAWLGLKDVISKTGDSLLNLGRAPTTQEQLATVRQQIAQAQGQDKNRPFSMPWDTKLPDLQKVLANLEAQAAAEGKAALVAGDRAVATAARARFEAQSDALLPMRVKLENEIAKARLDGAVAGKSQADIDAQIVNIRKKYVDQDAQNLITIRQQAVEQAGEIEASQVKENLDRINQLYKVGAISQAQSIDMVGQLEVKLLQDDKQRLNERLAIARAKQNSELEVADIKGKIALQDERIEARKRQIDRDQLARLEDLRKAEQAALVAMTQGWDSDIEQARSAEIQAYNQLQMSVYGYKQAIEDENKELDFQISVMGQSGVALQRLIELHKIDIGLRQKLREIDASKADPDTKASQAEIARQAAADAAAQVDTKIWVDQWNTANREVGDGLYDALTGRGQDAAHRLANLFESLVLKPTITGALQPISGAVASALTGGGPGGGVASGLSMASSAYSLATGGAGGIAGSVIGAYGAGSAAASGAAVSGLMANGMSIEAATAAVTANASVGVAGGLSAGISAGLAAVPVWGWIAMAGIALYSAFGNGGEMRSGGQYVNGAFQKGPTGGEIGQTGQASAITEQGINTTLQQAGSTATVANYVTGIESSKEGKGFAYAGGTLSTGATFGQSTQDAGIMNRRGSMSPEEAAAAFAEELKQSTLQALQAADVPGKLGDYLRSLGDIDKLTGGELDKAVAKVSKALTEKGTLEAQIYDLSHTDAEKMAMSRELERASIDDSNKALLERVYALQDEAAAIAKEKTRHDEQLGLEGQLLQLQGNTVELRNRERAALDETNRALYDSIQAEKDRQAVSNERLGLEGQLLQLQGNTVEIRRREREALDESNRAIYDEIQAEKDKQAAAAALAKAMDSAWSAVERAVSAQRQTLQLQAQLATEQRDAVKGLVDLLHSNVGELYGQVDATRQAGARSANTFIDQSLLAAQRTGYLPDQTQLTDAISAARAGLGGDGQSQQDADFQRLVLAGKLKALQDIAGPQLTTAERELKATQEQIDQLDALLVSEKNQLDALNGIDTSVLSVADAVTRLHDAMFGKGKAPATPSTSTASGGGTFSGVGGGASGGGGHAAIVWSEFQDYFNTYGAGPNGAERMAWYLKQYDETEASAAAGLGLDLSMVQQYFRNGGVPAFAAGGDHAGGWAMVGEQGPELAFLPPARIYNANDTRSMRSGADGGAVETQLRSVRDGIEQLNQSMWRMNRHMERTANAVNGQPEAPMLTQAT